MMKRSFTELSTHKKVSLHKDREVELRAKLETLPDVSSSHLNSIQEFYSAASQWLSQREELWSLVLAHPVPTKALQPGRLLVCTWGGKRNVSTFFMNFLVKNLQMFSAKKLKFVDLRDYHVCGNFRPPPPCTQRFEIPSVIGLRLFQQKQTLNIVHV